MPTRLNDLLVYFLLLGVLILAFFGLHGCAASPPPMPKWQDRVDTTSAVLLRGDGYECSGVAVADRVVLTAKHCVGRGPFVVVAFPGVIHAARLLDASPNLDLARVQTEGAPLEVQAKFAVALPGEGDIVFSAGFGCYGTLAVAAGLYLGPDPAGDLAFAAGVCRGDSGGPVFNERGELFGLLTQRGTTAPVGFAVDVRGF